MKLPPFENTDWWKKYSENSILLSYRGSISHGTFIPSSNPNSIDDVDVLGVYINPLSHYLGYEQKETYDFFEDQWDVVLYEFKKLVRLLSNSNPNVLNLLWTRDQDFLKKSPLGQKLLDNKQLFVSKKAYTTFMGYARSQLHKMTAGSFQGYMGDKRKKLVEQFGYDTKNASHLIRLLTMGSEFLKSGEMQVYRSDADHFIRIKKGEFTLEQIKQKAEELFQIIEEAYKMSPLPEEVDKEKINTLMVGILSEHFKIPTSEVHSCLNNYHRCKYE